MKAESSDFKFYFKMVVLGIFVMWLSNRRHRSGKIEYNLAFYKKLLRFGNKTYHRDRVFNSVLLIKTRWTNTFAALGHKWRRKIQSFHYFLHERSYGLPFGIRPDKPEIFWKHSTFLWFVQKSWRKPCVGLTFGQ